MAIDFNTSPYYDDYSDDKDFYRVLFKPGFPVQARELTQLQTILQNQVARFGNHVFKDGSKVSGGEIFIDPNAVSTKLLSTFNSTNISVSAFLNKFAKGDTSGFIGEVMHAFTADVPTAGDPPTIVVKGSNTENDGKFQPGETILFFDTLEDALDDTNQLIIGATVASNATVTKTATASTYSKVISVNSTTDINVGDKVEAGSISKDLFVVSIDEDTNTVNVNSYVEATIGLGTVSFINLASRKTLEISVAEGIFFRNGVFVRSANQSVVPAKYNLYPTCSVGFTITDVTVTADDDDSLLDPALNSTNYFAPGADRYKINLELISLVVLNDQPVLNDIEYIEVIRLQEGVVQKKNENSVYNELGKAIARRTYEESGDYILKNFILHLNDTTDSSTTIETDILPGKAYVRGYEVENISPRRISIDKARDTENVAGFDISTFYGNYVVVEPMTGSIPVLGANVELHYNTTPTSSTIIGTAHVKNIEYDSNTLSNANFKLFLHDINLTSNTFGDTRSLVITSVPGSYASNVTFKANVDATAITSNVAQLIESAYDTLIFDIPQTNISEVTDTTYTFKRVYKGVSFAAGNATISTSLSNEDFVGGSGVLPGSVAREYYAVVAASTSGTFTSGQFIPIDATGRSVNIAVVGSGSPGQATISVNDNTFNGTCDIIATIEAESYTEKTKTLAANTIQVVNIAASNTYYSLGVSDVNTVNGVYRLGSNVYHGAWSSGNTYSTSNVIVYSNLPYQANATSTGVIPAGNVAQWTPLTAVSTSNYDLDNGQRDNYYDHGRVRYLAAAPGNVIINFDYFTHTGTTGYFTVDSYPIDYSKIPTYTNKRTGKAYRLADSYDFRPRRTDSSSSLTFDSYKIPVPYDYIQSDYSYYLGRFDKIALTPDGVFKTIKGVSSFINPNIPEDDQDAMTLFILYVPPYTYTSEDINIEYISRRRYTMKDIGQIDQRLKSVEYYTALSLLEKETLAADVLDENNSALFKNGYLIDSFAGHSVGDVLNPDYKCSIDFLDNYARAPFDSTAYGFTFDANTNPDVNNTGGLISVPFTETVFVSQTTATKIINVNPFNVISFIGSLKLTPSSDTWFDTVSRPIINVVNNGDKDAWLAATNAAGTQWNNWQLNWTGQTTRDELVNVNNTGNGANAIIRTTTTTSSTFSRTGIRTSVGTKLVVNSDSTKLLSQEVIPFARQKTISFEVFGMPPVTRCYLFANNTFDLTTFITPDGGSLGGNLITDNNGYAKGTFVLPNTASIKIPTGRISLTLTNSSISVVAATARASATFVSSGTLNIEQRTVVSTREPVILREAVTDTRTDTTVSFNTRTVVDATQPATVNNNRPRVTWVDPVAESFLIDKSVYPNGIYLNSVDLFFATKDTSLPVWVQLRPMENGSPNSSVVIPFSEIYKNPSEITVPPEVNIFDGIGEPTNFEFEAPVYLAPGEYCVVVLSNSDKYNLYASEMGQKQLGTSNLVNSQPYLGALFKSQNGSTWTPSQTEDLCFKLNMCKFERGTKTFEVNLELPDSSFNYDLVKLNTQELNFGNKTKINYSLKSKTAGGSTFTDFINVPTGVNYEFTETMNASAAGDIVLRITLENLDENISPVIDLERLSTILVQNKIDTATTPILNSELNSIGGLAQARYITRRVTLTEGLDATGLNVNLLVNRRPGTDIKVYYKVLNKYDSTSFDNRPYVLMDRSALSGDVVFTDNPESYTEETYKALDISYTSGSANYNDFKVFAIKVVFFSTTQPVTPKIKALRVTAVT